MASSANLVLACTAVLFLSWAPCPTSTYMMMEGEACDLLCPASWGGEVGPWPGWKRGRSYYGRGLSWRRGGRIMGREGSAPGRLSQGDWLGILLDNLGSIVGAFFDFDSVFKLASNILERSWGFTKQVMGPVMARGGKKPVHTGLYNSLVARAEEGGAPLPPGGGDPSLPGVPLPDTGNPNPGNPNPGNPNPGGPGGLPGEIHLPFRFVINVPQLMGLIATFFTAFGYPEVAGIVDVAAQVVGAFRIGEIDVSDIIEKLYGIFAGIAGAG